MKKTLFIAGIATLMLALASGISYLEILMFKALDISIHGVPYMTWLENFIRTYWPMYALAGIACVGMSVFCAKTIYSDLKA